MAEPEPLEDEEGRHDRSRLVLPNALALQCSCGATLPVPIHCEIYTGDDGRVRVETSPDITLMWMHYAIEHLTEDTEP